MKKTMFVAVAILAIILGIVAYASADTASVLVNAQVNPKLLLTVDTTGLTLAATDPGVQASTAGPTANVKSNKAYSFTTGWSAAVNSAAAMWSDTYANSANHVRSGAAGDDFSGNVRFTPDYSVDSQLPSQALITFTAAQN